MFGKTQKMHFNQAILTIMSTQDELSFINSKPSNIKKSTRILLISQTLFKLHINSNESIETQT